MSEFVIYTDSACDITPDILAGWSVRYKRKLFHDEGELGNSWYVPGFGINDRDQIAANFNVIIDI